MSGVFQNIDLPLPHFPASVYHPAFGAGGEQTRWVKRGWGVNTLEDARHSSVLFICKYFVEFIYIWRSNKKQRSCDGRGGAQRPVWGMSSKRRVRAAHGRARAAQTH
jgi:hypothetical protein